MVCLLFCVKIVNYYYVLIVGDYVVGVGICNVNSNSLIGLIGYYFFNVSACDLLNLIRPRLRLRFRLTGKGASKIASNCKCNCNCAEENYVKLLRKCVKSQKV